MQIFKNFQGGMHPDPPKSFLLLKLVKINSAGKKTAPEKGMKFGALYVKKFRTRP